MDLMHGGTCGHITGTSPGVWSWAWVLGQARTASALLELGWSLGNLAGAQAFVMQVYPCCCLSWREWLSFQRDSLQQVQGSC